MAIKLRTALLLLATVRTLMSADLERVSFAPNPTEYTFNESIERVTEAISLIPKKVTRFSDFFVSELPTAAGEKRRFSVAKAIGKVNYFDIYFYRTKPADYLALFDVAVFEKSATLTKVVITTIGSRVSVPGHGFNIHSFTFDQDRSIPVKPTTVEEYEILLTIGAITGEKGMPPLNIPQKITK